MSFQLLLHLNYPDHDPEPFAVSTYDCLLSQVNYEFNYFAS